MYIYKNKQNDSEHILDPDYIYHDSFEEGQLYSFYKNLVKPEHIDMIAGIYIYNMIFFLFHSKNTLLYMNILINPQKNSSLTS